MGKKQQLFLSPPVDSTAMAGQEEISAWTTGGERGGPVCDGHWGSREPMNPGVSTGQHSPGARRILVLGASRRIAVGQGGSRKPMVSMSCWGTDQLSIPRKSLRSLIHSTNSLRRSKQRFSLDSKSKNQQVGLYPTKKLLHSKGIYQQKEKAIY